MANFIITGTSSGIGLELTKLLCQSNHKVLGISRRAESVIIPEFQKNYKSINIDFKSEMSVSSLFSNNLFIEFTADVNYVVLNSAVLFNKSFQSFEQNEIVQSFQVNTLSQYQIIRTILNIKEKIKSNCSFIYINSMGGISNTPKFPGLSAYSPSKGATALLFECLAEEYKDFGFQFNSIALGAVNTKMLQKAFPDYKAQTNPIDIAEFISDFILKYSKLFSGKTIQVSNTTP